MSKGVEIEHWERTLYRVFIQGKNKNKKMREGKHGAPCQESKRTREWPTNSES